MGNGEIRSLTGLRFVAAFFVFVFHIHIRWPIVGNGFISNILGQGAVGMSLFFVLSGFVLTYRYVDAQCTVRNYLINRFARIYPVYVAVAIFTLPWIGIDLYGSSEQLKHIFQVILLVFSNIFVIQAWFPQYFSHWNDGGSWSISVEFFCYILLPFFLNYFSCFSKKKLYVALFTFWLLAVLPGISASLFDAPSNNVFYSIPIFRLSEFMIGVCTYLIIRSGRRYQWGNLLQIVIILIVLFYLGIVGSTMSMYVGHNWIVLPAIAFIIFSLCNGKGLIASSLGSSVFVWLGKISYCFYSFQVLLILFLINYHDRLLIFLPVLLNTKVLLVSSFVLLVLLSSAGYYFIEEPSRRWIRKYHKNISGDLVLGGKLVK